MSNAPRENLSTARTREEHLQRATGSFASVDANDSSARTNNPRALKAAARQKTAAPQIFDNQAEGAESIDCSAVVPGDSQGSAVVRPGAGSAVGAGSAASVGSVPSAAALEAVGAFAAVGTAPSANAVSAPDAAGAANATPAPKRPSVRAKRTTRDAAESRKDADFALATSGAEPPRKGAAPAGTAPGADSAGNVAGVDPNPSNGASNAGAPAARPARRESVEKAQKRVGRGLLALRIALVAVLVSLVAIAGAFSFFRWLQFDDASDMQGLWYIAGTDTPITISESDIILNDEVSYGYTLDAKSKSIAFTFSYLEGGGHYRFSLDRNQLAIMDGDFDWWDTLANDFGWTAKALVSAAQGKGLSPAGDHDVTLLSRMSASEEKRAAEEAAAAAAASGPESAADSAADPAAAPDPAAVPDPAAGAAAPDPDAAATPDPAAA